MSAATVRLFARPGPSSKSVTRDVRDGVDEREQEEEQQRGREVDAQRAEVELPPAGEVGA